MSAPKVKLPRAKSVGEEMLALHIRAMRLPEPARELAFAKPARAWRFDFSWPDLRLACEVDGGTKFGKSRHSRGDGFEKDADKFNAAARMGWIVLRFTTRMVRDGRAIKELESALRQQGFQGETR